MRCALHGRACPCVPCMPQGGQSLCMQAHSYVLVLGLLCMHAAPEPAKHRGALGCPGTPRHPALQDLRRRGEARDSPCMHALLPCMHRYSSRADCCVGFFFYACIQCRLRCLTRPSSPRIMSHTASGHDPDVWQPPPQTPPLLHNGNGNRGVSDDGGSTDGGGSAARRPRRHSCAPDAGIGRRLLLGVAACSCEVTWLLNRFPPTLSKCPYAM